MFYTNPIFFSDCSDPDVIRAGDWYYMVCSSFNRVPGVPVLRSQNLVDWELVNYVLDKLPFESFDKVRHGCGAWAPSIRYNNGKFYCLIPFPDEGIYVSETDDPCGKWSLLRPLIEGKGLIDPCPVWLGDKCYVVFAFAKSRAGFNSKLAMFETDAELKTAPKQYSVIYDGRDMSPLIEGPKIYRRGKYFYILAPAGGIKTGWQVALRSEKIYGPYETKIVLMQGDTEVNGPHQGALIETDEGKWAFIHTHDLGAYGRVLHLQPVVWRNEWPFIGEITDDEIAGVPQKTAEYPVNKPFPVTFSPTDEFDGDKLSLVWQTPANMQPFWYELKRGLKLNCIYYGGNTLSDLPQLFMQKIYFANFSVTAKCKLNLKNDGDETGFAMFGKKYTYVCVTRRDGINYIEIRGGEIGGERDELLAKSQPCDDGSVTFKLSAKRERNNLTYKLSCGGAAFTRKFIAEGGVWTGAGIGVYARAAAEGGGFSVFKFFRVTRTDKMVSKADDE